MMKRVLAITVMAAAFAALLSAEDEATEATEATAGFKTMRDPFWPIGWTPPPPVEKQKETQKQLVTQKKSLVNWKDAGKKAEKGACITCSIPGAKDTARQVGRVVLRIMKDLEL